jgi:DNA-directed RNA polymerase subunit RPC12/RpoP
VLTDRYKPVKEIAVVYRCELCGKKFETRAQFDIGCAKCIKSILKFKPRDAFDREG